MNTMKTISQKMMFLILLISLVSCEKQDDNLERTSYELDDKEYISHLNPGYKAEYEGTIESDNSTFSLFIKLICYETDVKNPIDETKDLIVLEKTVTVISANEEVSLIGMFYYEIATDGIYLHGLLDSEDNTYWVNEGSPEKLDFDYFIGATISNAYTIDGLKNDFWPNDTIWNNLDNKIENTTIEDIEYATCDLGSFECFKLMKSTTSKYLNEHETSWNYPNIGVIKRKLVTTGMGLSIEYNYELTKTNLHLE